MNTDITLLILAAGRGSRYGGTKQFDSVGNSGEYLLEFSIYDAIQVGFNQVVIVTSENLKATIEQYLSERIPSSVSIKCVIQDVGTTPIPTAIDRQKPWGTAHAVWSSRETIDGPFVIVNADDYYGKNALKIAFDAAVCKGENNDYHLIAFQLKNTVSKNGTVSRGICETEGNNLLSIEEFTNLTYTEGIIRDDLKGNVFSGDEYVSMNLWVLTPQIFKAIESQFSDFINQSINPEKEELYLPSIIQNQIAQKEVVVDVKLASSEWMGMTYALDKADVSSKLKSLVESGIYPSELWMDQ